jgi:hypothetical protein
MSLSSNLKIDQSLRECKFTEDTPKVYSTGVYLVPMKISIRGIEQYVWVADDFNDETFNSEGKNVSPRVISDSIEELYI